MAIQLLPEPKELMLVKGTCVLGGKTTIALSAGLGDGAGFGPGDGPGPDSDSDPGPGLDSDPGLAPGLGVDDEGRGPTRLISSK